MFAYKSDLPATGRVFQL